MDDKIIQDRLENLEPSYRTFVCSDVPSTITASLAEIHKLDDVSLLTLENGFILFLLYFLNKDEFTLFIVEECHINPEQAILLTNAFILALPSDIRAAYEKTLNATSEPANSKLFGEIQETEALLNNMPSLRTINQATTDSVYTSTQAAILQDSLHNPTNSDGLTR